MITDSIMAAINIMINNCKNEEQRKGMDMIGNMLADFDEDNWHDLTDSGACIEWVKQYMK